jgi:hypothetical protein
MSRGFSRRGVKFNITDAWQARSNPGVILGDGYTLSAGLEKKFRDGVRVLSRL